MEIFMPKILLLLLLPLALLSGPARATKFNFPLLTKINESQRKSQQKIPCLQGFRVVRLFYPLRKSTQINENYVKPSRGQN